MATETIANTLVLLVSRDVAAAPMPREGDPWQLEIAESGWQALERVQSSDCPDLVLLDLGENAADGLHTLRWLRRVRPDICIVLLSKSEDTVIRTEGLRLGAQGFLLKPISGADWSGILDKHIEHAHKAADFAVSADTVEEVGEGLVFVSASPAMQQLRAQAALLAQSDDPLLLVGQNGSGKHATARLIHKLSVRSGFEFLKINCSALPADLLEKELFSVGRTVVAGQSQSVSGKFGACQKGTLYFEEITGLSLELQEKLVRVLQDKALARAGGEAKVDCTFRIIAGTQANLEEALAEGKLREDLYFRLSAFTVYVPSLRQRREDISLLLTQSMTQLSRHYDLPSRTFTPAVLSACRSYLWPGNLKELENFAKRYLVVGDDELAVTELERKAANSSELPAGRNKIKPEPASPEFAADGKETHSGLKSIIESVKGEAERSAIATALEQTHWNRKAASKVLQVSYRTLLYKIQHYHLSPPSTYLSPVFAAQGVKSDGNRR